jgi:hypothetical protein
MFRFADSRQGLGGAVHRSSDGQLDGRGPSRCDERPSDPSDSSWSRAAAAAADVVGCRQRPAVLRVGCGSNRAMNINERKSEPFKEMRLQLNPVAFTVSSAVGRT